VVGVGGVRNASTLREAPATDASASTPSSARREGAVRMARRPEKMVLDALRPRTTLMVMAFMLASEQHAPRRRQHSCRSSAGVQLHGP